MIGLGIDLFRYGGGGGAEPTQLFNVVTYTGDSTTNRAITGVGFQPDFVWIKRRDAADGNILDDSVRGLPKTLFSDTDIVENTTPYLSSFDSDGFTLDQVYNPTNLSGGSYVAWCWKAGGTAVTNNDGSITSQVSANVDAGFSIVGYAGNGILGATVGHGLNSAPEMIIVKNRDAVRDWTIYHESIGATAYIQFDTNASVTASSRWNDTAPTSSVFTIGNSTRVNESASSHIAYCFHSVEGFSKIGSYTGTGADQAITGLGFQPDFVLIKRTDSTGNWCIADSARLTSGESNFLYPNLNNAESVSAVITMESDGFSMDGAGADYNASGGAYLYMAIKGPA